MGARNFAPDCLGLSLNRKLSLHLNLAGLLSAFMPELVGGSIDQFGAAYWSFARRTLVRGFNLRFCCSLRIAKLNMTESH